MGGLSAATFAHELVHAADDRLDTLADAHKEVVAELGAAVLLKLWGDPSLQDLGKQWRNIDRLAAAESPVLAVCDAVLDRVCRCVQLILTTAEGLHD